MENKKITVLDLFAGAGGFSEGFINSGCEMIAHIEMDVQACETIRSKHIFGEEDRYILSNFSQKTKKHDLGHVFFKK
jgi:site-specific DNA-cytosine methylase